MIELTSLQKNKVNLTDYNYLQDIESRMHLCDFSTFDQAVLEEILFSPLKISIKKLSRAVSCAEEDLAPILQRFSASGLIQVQGDTIVVDKERRKYFEFQITRFEENFKPDMEFLQEMLRQVPIHILPAWYSIPRSSDNIFDSIVEKYLLTPHIYQRYLHDLTLPDPIVHRILNDVLSSPELRVCSSDLIAKYNLDRRHFENLMLQLEYSLACFTVYTKDDDDHWSESVVPFYEWSQYLQFLRSTEAQPIANEAEILRYRESDFGFVEDMGAVLNLVLSKPLSLERWDTSSPLPPALVRTLGTCCRIPHKTPEELRLASHYLTNVMKKLLLVKLAACIDGKLYALETANDWLELNLENRALNLYRHPLNRLLLDAPLASEKHLREAERSIKRVLHGEWVFFDEFLRGVIVPLNEESTVMLKKSGKQWKYSLPSFSDDEKALFKAALFNWLFECGMIVSGVLNGRECFATTSFGRCFFED